MILTGAGLVWWGCNSKKDESSAPLPAPGRAASKIQLEIERVHHGPADHQPNNRPLVVSERAPDRRGWLLRCLERGYAASGHTNGHWDAPVRSAFEAFADYTRGGQPERYSPLTNAVIAAAKAGCDDPMIQYCQARYALAETNRGREGFALGCLRAHEGLIRSQYHPLLKFFAGLRAVQAAREAEPKSDSRARVEITTVSLEDLARDTNAPPAEVFEAAFLWLEVTAAKGWADYMMSDLEGILEKNWGREEGWFRLRGAVEIKRAWDARGGGWANSVSEKGFEDFSKHLSKAETALTQAWQMNPSNSYTAYMSMQVELGQGHGRGVMERWFRRAMALSTNYYDAAKLMSFYLEPRWYGSEDDALEFARSCVGSTNWGGTVPLVLPEVHRSLAVYHSLSNSPIYWHRPEVWTDVHAAYEKFFQLNPNDYGYRHDYARHAFWCGHYAEFLAQTKLFTGGTNFSFFGGEPQFREMLAQAAAAAGPKN